MKEPLRTYPTIACIDRYQLIAELNLNRFDELDEEILLLQTRSDEILAACKNPQSPPLEYFEVHAQLDPLIEERRQCFVIAMMFTLLYFETYIYSYAVTHTSEPYFRDHFSKLKLAEKWSVIPGHVTGFKLSTKNPGYAALMQLCEDEPRLTQLKADETEFEGAVIAKDVHAKKISMVVSVKNCKVALGRAIQELDSLTQTHLHQPTANTSVRSAPISSPKDSSIRV